MRLPLWRRRQDESLDEEVRSHLQMATRDRIEQGENPDDAARHAVREFGNVLHVRETVRDEWGWVWLEQLGQDIQYALRQLRKAFGFSTVAVITLALGIGANTAMFSVIEAVLLRPLPFPNPDRLVAVGEVAFRSPGSSSTVSWPNYFDWRSRVRTLTSISAYRSASFTVTGLGPAQHLPGEVVSADFFSTLGVQPAIGRAFRPDEEHLGSNVVVVSDRFWRSQLGASPEAVGEVLTVGGRRFSIIGVMPAGFRFPVTFPPPELWTTVAEDARVDSPTDTPVTAERGAHFLQVIGRLTGGARIQDAQAEVDVIARALAAEYPRDDKDRGIRVIPELEAMVGQTKGPLLVLLAAVGCVLLIACGNVASLLTARGAGRQREIALRAALGASRRRIVRLLLTESVVLSALGAGCGLALAAGAVRLLVNVWPTSVRGLDEVVVIDTPVLILAATLTVACALLFGMAPALAAARRDLTHDLGSLRSTAGRPQRRLLNGLVIAETAIGVTLLVTATLLIRGFERLTRTDPGFNPSRIVTLKVDLPDSRYPFLKQVAFYDEVLPVLARQPGVEAVAAVGPLPFSGERFGISFELPVRSDSSAVERLNADFAFVSPGYFRALKIPLRRGREFTAADGDAAPRVVVINERFAQQYFPGEDPIGKRMKPGLSTTERETPWRRIVGVVGNIRQKTLNETINPAYYVPSAQGMITTPHLLLRAAQSPDAILNTVRKIIAARDPELAIHDVKSMDDHVADSLATPRFEMALLTMFAALGLVLTAVGLYGVLTYNVSQRAHEFGLRVALGARPRDVLSMVLGRAVVLAGTGLILGMLAAASLARAVAHALDFVNPADGLAFASVAMILLAVAAAAGYVPARRASHVDPMVTMRAE